MPLLYRRVITYTDGTKEYGEFGLSEDNPPAITPSRLEYKQRKEWTGSRSSQYTGQVSPIYTFGASGTDRSSLAAAPNPALLRSVPSAISFVSSSNVLSGPSVHTDTQGFFQRYRLSSPFLFIVTRFFQGRNSDDSADAYAIRQSGSGTNYPVNAAGSLSLAATTIVQGASYTEAIESRFYGGIIAA